MAAADTTRSVVNVAASTSLGAKTKRHSSELAAKQSIAAAVNISVRKGIPLIRVGTAPRCMSACGSDCRAALVDVLGGSGGVISDAR